MRFTIYDLPIANGGRDIALRCPRPRRAGGTGRGQTFERNCAAKRGPDGAARSTSAFTMMEIAISLAVIGIALVAIIGVLPIGMNVQQTNREETIVGQDASVLMEAIRNGSLGYDDLTNYVYGISNYWTEYEVGGLVGPKGVNSYTYGSVSIDSKYPGATGLPIATQMPITNAANIIGLLSTPEYTGARVDSEDDVGEAIPSLFFGGISNHIVAYCYSMSGPAIEKPPQDNQILQQDSFGYHIYCVNAPAAIDTNVFYSAPNGPWSDRAYGAGSTVFFNWTYWTCPGGAAAGLPAPGVPTPGKLPVWQMTPNYTLEQALNLHELRLTFEFPKLGNGGVGPGRQTYRTMVAGQLLHQPPLVLTNGLPVNSIWYNSNLWSYLSESFTNTP
jgi:type II secretory pathway pseudopilin PulG